MTTFHEMIAEMIIEDNGESHVINSVERFREILSTIQHEQILIISVVGTYQIGKSSLIQLLTHDPQIQAGDGIKEQTLGAFIYGPYDSNTIRNRFGLENCKDMKIFFIDTEGICGFHVGTNPVLNQLLLTRILGPCVALSQVCIVMHRYSLENETAEYLNNFFDIVSQLINGNSLTILDVIPNRPFKNVEGQELTLEQKYQNAVQVLNTSMPSKITSVHISKFIPTSRYSEDDSPLSQSPAFNERFKLAARDILESVESARNSHYYDAQGIIEQFNFLIENMNRFDYRTLAREAQRLGEMGTAERIYAPLIADIIEQTKYEIERNYPQIIDEFIDEESKLLMQNKPSLEQILANAYQALDQHEMAPIIRETCVPKFKRKIEDDVTNYYNERVLPYRRSIALYQIHFIVSKILNKAESDVLRAKLEIPESTKLELTVIKDFDQGTMQYMKETLHEYEDSFKLSINSEQTIRTKVSEYIEKCTQELLAHGRKTQEAKMKDIKSSILKTIIS